AARGRFRSTRTISRPTPRISRAYADADPTMPQPTMPTFTGAGVSRRRPIARRPGGKSDTTAESSRTLALASKRGARAPRTSPKCGEIRPRAVIVEEGAYAGGQ